MAIINEGVLGGFRGKIGPVVGVSNGNTFYMRSRPGRKTKQTDKELLNQAKFKLVQNHLEPIKDLVRAGFKDHYTKTGGYRAAFAYNRKHALAADDTGFYIDPALFRISGGDLPGAENSLVEVNGGTLKISWSNATVSGSGSSDQMILLVYQREGSRVLTRTFDGAYRRAESFEVAIPADMAGKEADIYIGFIAADRSAQSDSQYLGRFTL